MELEPLGDIIVSPQCGDLLLKLQVHHTSPASSVAGVESMKRQSQHFTAQESTFPLTGLRSTNDTWTVADPITAGPIVQNRWISDGWTISTGAAHVFGVLGGRGGVHRASSGRRRALHVQYK